MRIGIIAYVPPPKRFQSDAFVANLSHWKTDLPIFLYSDYPRDTSYNHIANPDVVKAAKFPFAVNNCVYLFGLKLAVDAKLDKFLYLEADCRVRGDHWAERIFDDCFRGGNEPLIYGTPVGFNLSQGGGIVVKRFIQLFHNSIQDTGCPPAVHGAWPGSPLHPILFSNGASSIYDTKLATEIFTGFDKDIGRAAISTPAFDHTWGVGLWKKFGAEMFDHFQYSRITYSGFGDTLMDFHERKTLLLSGKMACVHQIKSDDTFIK